MSDIKAGDIVVIVEGVKCCRNQSSIGKIFTVASFDSGPIHAECRFCGHVWIEENPFVRQPDGLCVEMSRIRKINPPKIKRLIHQHTEEKV